MGYIIGFFKYVLKGPFTNTIPFFIYGSGLMALWAGLTGGIEGQGIVAAVFYYYEAKYIPPTTLGDILIPIAVGTVVAGVKWYIKTVVWSSWRG